MGGIVHSSRRCAKYRAALRWLQASGLGLQASRYAQIWDYGFANPEHSITAICR